MSKAWRVLGSLFSRAGGLARSMGKTFGGLRDLWPTLGYRDSPDVETYLSFYARGDVASQIVDLPPDTCWRFPPELRLEDDADRGEGKTFLDEVDELDDRIGLWAKMAQIDRLSGIGRYGLLLIGARGQGEGETLREPLEGLTSLKDVMFLKAFHEGLTDIASWVTDEMDPRFGLPETYNVDFNTGSDRGGTGSSRSSVVHWSRVIHVAENLVDDETFGIPRLERVINKLDDLNKLIGSAAEIFWVAVAGVLHADIDPDVDVDEEDQEQFEADLIEAMQGIRRVVQTRGVELNRIAQSGTVDPGPTYEAIVQLISATARIPERVLFGSERGELASSQDQQQWHATIVARQNNHVEPVIVRAFFNRLAMLGVKIPDYEVFWAPLDSPSEKQLAEIAKLKAETATMLAPGGQADLLIKPWEGRQMLGLTAVPPDPPEGAEEAFFELIDETLVIEEPVPPAQLPPPAEEAEVA
jgi:phage-related protein (TIGR01555 family)